MQARLIQRYHEYIRENHPDILLELEQQVTVTAYLDAKIRMVTPLLKALQEAKVAAHEIEFECMNALVLALGPSRYNYVLTVLEQEFEETYTRMDETGIIVYEVINMMAVCEAAFDTIGLDGDDDGGRQLYYLITAAIDDYLQNS